MYYVSVEMNCSDKSHNLSVIVKHSLMLRFDVRSFVFVGHGKYSIDYKYSHIT